MPSNLVAFWPSWKNTLLWVYVTFHSVWGQNTQLWIIECLEKYCASHFAACDIDITPFSPIISSPENMVTTHLKISPLQQALQTRRWVGYLKIPPVSMFGWASETTAGQFRLAKCDLKWLKILACPQNYLAQTQIKYKLSLERTCNMGLNVGNEL